MDLQNQFKDLNLDENLEKEAKAIEAKANTEEHEQIISDLEKRLAEIKSAENNSQEEVEEEIYEDDESKEKEELTLYEKLQPFIWPIMLTFFAIVFAGLFLYFFSKSRIENAVAITNTGNIDPVYVPPPSTPVIVVKEPEPLKCEPPKYLNETGDECLEPEPEPEPVKAGFENGTTTILHVRFSYDKFNYDNYPRGIYLLEDQIFDGDYKDFKLAPTNRAFANDHFFGVDRYTVSLIGVCSYVVDDAKILVKDVNAKEKYFTGNVVKIVEASKARVDCTRK